MFGRCLPVCLLAWQSTCLPSDGYLHHLSVSQSRAASLLLALVKPLFNISTGRQSKTTFSLSGNQRKHAQCPTKTRIPARQAHTHTHTHLGGRARTDTHSQPCQPAVDGHSDKARVHKQRACLFGQAGAKRRRANKMTWLQRRWGEGSSVLVVSQRVCVRVRARVYLSAGGL